jgi:hypothetical protein
MAYIPGTSRHTGVGSQAAVLMALVLALAAAAAWR